MKEELLQKIVSGFIDSKISLGTKVIITLVVGGVAGVAIALIYEGVFRATSQEGDSAGSLVMGMSFLYACWMVFMHSVWKWMNASDYSRIILKSLLLASAVGYVSYLLAGIGVAIIATILTIIGGMFFLRS